MLTAEPNIFRSVFSRKQEHLTNAFIGQIVFDKNSNFTFADIPDSVKTSRNYPPFLLIFMKYTVRIPEERASSKS